ncbi:MAG: pyridoxal-phosphate dependent enzyme [Mesorhizobium sp.]|uniref:threonine synthase n=1 Tax=Mesorhizobium sp. TaxID=1871066 RepID=UPI000FD2EF10|nr:pyridoxal-phosphate dependent enzyme [Mesorhizobium sp.]RUV29091.1 pyridoxal-phosphate dependent enzyme [Mesorhizobium sp. M5C.F.Ca.IN.020.32.2.1]RUV91149.1 pyridoxal-phosphate dependent enzyme [Mesorhizobium sp. M5C.F.Ca.IN.020.14.1.1]RWE12683.1 MAG: pyridoxal-phosphate dependent enzyme [Mesorhizobium sp.]RWH42642.1 MAG: pyridoxal-phosphate dependent enzyme [Mesorhizobium sp.]RWH54460.1 MAG: pyridoxal-phosphate dependent enzyme [Mesorhizobium sp.]
MNSMSQRGWRLRCQACGTGYDFAPMVHGCPACAAHGRIGLLELTRTYSLKSGDFSGCTGRGLDRWLDVLPVQDKDAFLSLGAGGTALIHSRIIGRRLGIPHLYFKLEQQNPTASFKDRFVAMSANAARSFGFRKIVVSSTGNLAVAVAAYAAALEMESMVIVPHGTPAGILAEASFYNAKIAVTDRELRFSALETAARRPDWFPIGLFLAKPVQNAFGVEGYRTFAYEVIEDLGEAPGTMLFPCARGNGLYGAFKGFLDCQEAGLIATLPRLVATQPEKANSIEVSLARGSDSAVELPPFESVAKSTSEAVSSDDALDAIRESGGYGLSASEEEIQEAAASLAEEGLNVETSSALPVACLPKLVRADGFDRERPVVCVLTAGGPRWMDPGKNASPRIFETATISDFERLLDKTKERDLLNIREGQA